MLATQGIDLIKSFPTIAYLKFSEWRDAELQQEDDGWHDTLMGVGMAIHRDIGIGKQSEKKLQQKINERMASGTLGDTKELQYKINERGVGLQEAHWQDVARSLQWNMVIQDMDEDTHRGYGPTTGPGKRIQTRTSNTTGWRQYKGENGMNQKGQGGPGHGHKKVGWTEGETVEGKGIQVIGNREKKKTQQTQAAFYQAIEQLGMEVKTKMGTHVTFLFRLGEDNETKNNKALSQFNELRQAAPEISRHQFRESEFQEFVNLILPNFHWPGPLAPSQDEGGTQESEKEDEGRVGGSSQVPSEEAGSGPGGRPRETAGGAEQSRDEGGGPDRAEHHEIGKAKKRELSDQEEDRSHGTEAEKGMVVGKGQSDNKYLWAPQPPDDARMDLPQLPSPRPQETRLPGRVGPAEGRWATSIQTDGVKSSELIPPDEREEEGEKEDLDDVTHDEEHAQTQARDSGRKQKGQQPREEHENT